MNLVSSSFAFVGFDSVYLCREKALHTAWNVADKLRQREYSR